MGLGLGGSYSSSTQKSTFDQTQTGSQKQTGSQTGSSVTTSLDPATIQILNDVIGGLAGSFTEGSTDAAAIRQLSGQLASNTDPATVQANVDASVNEAQRQFNAGQGAQIAQLQQLVGSKGNSFSQLIENMGNVDLSTSLAKIVADIRMNSSSQHGQELASAIGGYATASEAGKAPLQQLLSAIASLTGARTETQTEESQLMELLTNMVTKGSSTTKSSGFGVGATLGGK